MKLKRLKEIVDLAIDDAGDCESDFKICTVGGVEYEIKEFRQANLIPNLVITVLPVGEGL